jgi:hypothetical protein
VDNGHVNGEWKEETPSRAPSRDNRYNILRMSEIFSD